MNILILSAGRRVELLENFQKALKNHGLDGKVLAADAAPQMSAACQVADGHFTLPRVTSGGYAQALHKLCLDQQVRLVIPTIDTELPILCSLREDFARDGIIVLISSCDLVMSCRDKRKTGQLFQSIDIPYPTIYARSSLTFPCFCKPYDGSSSIGTAIIRGKNELTHNMLANEKNIFMEFIGPEYKEYTVDGYYDRYGTLQCLVPRERIEVRAGEVSKGITRKHFVYEFLWPRLFKLKGFRGCCTIQVFGNPQSGDIKGLEINPRFGGGFPLSSAAGADYPDWLVREYFLQQEIGKFEDWTENLLMLRYDAKVVVHVPD